MVSVGIDIGSFSIKVAALRATPRGYDVIKLDEYALSQDPAKDRTIEILEALRDVRSRYADADTVFAAAAHQDRVSLRRRSFPFRERHKITKSLPFELEDDIPLNLENAVYDFRTSYFVDGQAHVIAAAASKEYIKTFLE
jgi:general secretion pathway protein L